MFKSVKVYKMFSEEFAISNGSYISIKNVIICLKKILFDINMLKVRIQ